jgi:hypothetical protein
MTILSIGVLINAIVSALVFLAALSLTIFLWGRGRRLDEAMQAYKWFWLSTMLVWGVVAVRYFRISLGDVGDYIRLYDLVVHTGVFLTGPSLFYYLGLRVLRSRRLAMIGAWTSIGLAGLAFIFIQAPGGMPMFNVSIFSADSTINQVSFAIFSLEVIIILGLLIYDTIWRIKDWRRRGIKPQIYQAAYSGAIILYLTLGSIDESKVLTDWPLIVFRMLYAAGFLMVYLAITQDERSREQNLIRSSGLPVSYGDTPAN